MIVHALWHLATKLQVFRRITVNDECKKTRSVLLVREICVSPVKKMRAFLCMYQRIDDSQFQIVHPSAYENSVHFFVHASTD